MRTVVNIAPGFGGIHLEDIASPGVYEVERRLDDELEIPVLHDDQHGTAVVLLAAVLRALQLQARRLEDVTFRQIGLGSAGSAIAMLATEFPFRDVVAYDPDPAACRRLEQLAGDRRVATLHGGDADLRRVVASANVLVLATGRPNLLDASLVRRGQMIMALTNPVPEIDRRAALAAGAAVATDGSIVNNVLAYPGLLKGALDARARTITGSMKRAAAETLAALAPEGELLPDPLDASVHEAVAEAVAAAS